MEIFEYGAREIEHLKKACNKLGAIIDAAGQLTRPVNNDVFSALVQSVISQQISVKAADTIYARLENLVEKVTAKNILKKSIEELQSCGLSFRKAGYINGIAAAVASGNLDLKGLSSLSDDDVIAELMKLKGLGEWSAQMLMIFSLQRPNILSFGDLIIRKAIVKLYDLDSLTPAEFEYYRELYSPYGTVASIYLWWHGSQD